MPMMKPRSTIGAVDKSGDVWTIAQVDTGVVGLGDSRPGEPINPHRENRQGMDEWLATSDFGGQSGQDLEWKRPLTIALAVFVMAMVGGCGGAAPSSPVTST